MFSDDEVQQEMPWLPRKLAAPEVLQQSIQAYQGRAPSNQVGARPRDVFHPYGSTQDAVIVLDSHSIRVVSVNATAQKIFGVSLQQAHDLWLYELLPAHLHRAVMELQDRQPFAPSLGPLPLQTALGEQIQVFLDMATYPVGDGLYLTLVLSTRDSMQPDQATHLRDVALASCVNGVAITDMTLPDQPIIYVNAGFERLTGYRSDQIVGRNCRFLQRDDRNQPALTVLREHLRTGSEVRVVLRNYRKDGSLFWNELSLTPVHNRLGLLTHFIGVQNDVTLRMEFKRLVEPDTGPTAR